MNNDAQQQANDAFNETPAAGTEIVAEDTVEDITEFVNSTSPVAEAKAVNDLIDAKYNPRSMSGEEFKLLVKSMIEQGDLSSIIRNRTTNNLVGGHRRKDAVLEMLKRGLSASLEITERLESPNSVGTVARGYIVVGDEKFPYREVVWDLDWEMAANIAANAIGGEFIEQDLTELTHRLATISEDLLNMTGQTDAEIKALLGHNADDEQPNNAPPKFEIVIEARNTDEQQAIFDQLLDQGLKCRLQG